MDEFEVSNDLNNASELIVPDAEPQAEPAGEPAPQAEAPQPQVQQTYGGYTPPQPPPPPRAPKKKRGAGFVIAMICICLACFLLGGVVGAAAMGSLSTRLITAPGPVKIEQDTPVTPTEPEEAKPQAPQQPQEVPDFGGEAIGSGNTQTYADIYENLSPSVVCIEVYNSEYDEQLGADTPIGYSSGIVISKEGHVLFNDHSAVEGDRFVVAFPDGSKHESEYLGTDAATDSAVLKIEPFDGMTVAPLLSEGESVRIGEEIVVIGYPTGTNVTPSLTKGIVSDLDVEVTMVSEALNTIQIDAAINPGSSGGAVVNSEGKVVGIITGKSLVSGVDDYGNYIDADGMGYAIPIGDALSAAADIIAYGQVKKPAIGITCADVAEEDITMYKVPAGVMVHTVTEGGAADLAGIEVYDIIVGIDGVTELTTDILISEIRNHEIGDTVNLTYFRDGKTTTVKCVLQELK